MFKQITAFVLAIFVLSISAFAQNKGWYDKDHKDYHHWNATEQKNYTVFLGEKKITVHTFLKASPTERQQYWNWRHEHPDPPRK